MIILFKKSATGAILCWSIEVGIYGLEIHFGQYGGSIQDKEVIIKENNSGRSWDEQADLEMMSRVKKQIDRGYVSTIEMAKDNKPTNSLGLPMPMLAKTYGKVSVPSEVHVQYKLDGNRCMITKRDGVVFAYSRNGRPIGSIGHILDSALNIPEGTILDGELYHHGTSLQKIRSWISRNQADSKKLEFICYDMISNEGYPKRLETIKNLNLSYPIKVIESELIPTVKLELGLSRRLKKAIKNGYEGLIVRTLKSPYKDGRRSDTLLKVKSWLDDEFVVRYIEESKDGWAILNCVAGNGSIFSVSAPGGIDERHRIYKNKSDHVGKTVTVKYAYLTNEGIPFHPVAVAWRDGE